MNRFRKVFIIAFFVFLSLVFFRNVFLKHQIPFPANLLASYYQPWASYQWFDYAHGPPNKPIGFDNLRIFYPLRNLVISQIKSFQLPLWNPYNFSGNTLLATYQSAVFHPLSFLFLVMPQITAWSAIIMLTPIFAGLFMYLFLRKLKASTLASLMGAITFAFSGFMIVWWEESFMQAYSALFLPLMLLGVEEILNNKRARGFLILIVAIVASVVSGWFQMTFYSGLVLVVWIIYRTWRLPMAKKQISVFAAAVIASFLIAGIHLIPSAESYKNSARSSTDARYLFDNYLSPASHLATIIAPDFFGNPGTYNYFEKNGFYHERMLYFGIPQLFLLLYVLMIWKKHKDHERFFLLLFLIALSLGFSLPTSWFFLYYLKLPLLSVIIPSRIFFISTFAASVIAAYGIDRFRRGFSKKPFIAAVILMFLSLAVVAIAAFLENNPGRSISLRNLVIPAASVVLTIIMFSFSEITKRFKTVICIAAIIISLVGSLYLANKFLYFSDPRLVFPETPVLTKLKEIEGYDRFWSYGTGYIESNFATYYHLFGTDGYDSFFIQRYGELIASVANHGVYTANISRADARIETPDRFGDILKSPWRARLLSLLGVKYVLGTTGIEREEKTIGARIDPKLPRIWTDGKYSIYEYADALPRVFLADDYRVATKTQDILNLIYNPSINLTKTIILEQKPAGFTPSPDFSGTATITNFTPNEMTIKISASNNALLFFSDAYYPGWKAFVDGKETPLYRADYAFRAAVVPQGSHVVSFSYQPLSFKIGVWLTGVGLLIGAIVYFSLKREVS
ncbi:MAG TPA: YfhO family protein [Patescibacteria group bacterium]|nr:YfhO family protein [Patescibacteria group bacterium]